MTKDKIKLFVVEGDAIYRLGLCTAIANYPDLEIVGTGDFGNDTWRDLTQGLVINVLVVGLNDAAAASSAEFCQQIHQLYPQLPLFALSDINGNSRKRLRLGAWGIKGYCDRRSNIDTIIAGIHAVAYGDVYWQKSAATRPKLWQTALSRLSKSGRLELAQEIERIESQLKNSNLSDWEKVFLVGRKRELSTARWLSNRLVAEDIEQLVSSAGAGKLVPTPPTELAALPIFEDSANKKVFERVVTDIQISLINRSKIPLEIDILQPQIAKSLCQVILKRLSETVQQISIFNTVDRNYIEYLRELWAWTINDFFTIYYGELTAEENAKLQQIIGFESISVERNILDYIYGMPELVEYLLGKPGLVIDNIVYQSDDSEAIARIEFLLHNLVINLANGVILVVLNNFYDLEVFKYKLYKAEYKSDRELARFRNQLSWKYRQEKYFDRPQNIFESRYRIFAIDNGIRTTFIYAPRKVELEQLSGIPWLTTIIIEIRDAIAPLARKFIAFAGSGVVFVLTQVVGKGLGLVGKGIIQGIGSSIKDVNSKK